ncbi:uncharacterized protein LOC130678909 isoform X4 [Manis pentadactyla]|uniref:uncharacterized protein LOC130678909 isoform X4 n=1 Tax=Manis pentadactyla TaxID=143292 RepID=UPI00255C54B4|nr:uncharacterized protein LOC130678909 isoform X4 [Manis pentadactyla]
MAAPLHPAQIPQGVSWPCLVVSRVPQSWSRVVGYGPLSRWIPEAWATILARAGVRRHAEMSEPPVVPQKASPFSCFFWDADRQENVSGHCVGFRAPSFWPVPLVAVGTASSSQPWAVCMSLLEL